MSQPATGSSGRRLLAAASCLLLMALASDARAHAGHEVTGAAVRPEVHLVAAPDEVSFSYVVRFGEIAGLTERGAMDADADGLVDQSERDAYLSTVQARVVPDLVLLLDGLPLEMRLTERILEMDDDRVLPAPLRVGFRLTSDLPELGHSIHRLFFLQGADWGHNAVYSTQAVADHGVELFDHEKLRETSAFGRDPRSATFPTRSLDLLVRLSGAVPLEEDVARVLESVDAGVRVESGTDGEGGERRLLDILRDRELSPQLVLWAMLFALFLGGAHAIEPGHGKAVVAAYLVGSRGKVRHAVVLGLIVTLTHTLGVFILGLVALYAARYFVPGEIVPWTGFLSGLIIACVGLYLLARRPGHHHHDHAHGHRHDDHHHDHDDHAREHPDPADRHDHDHDPSAGGHSHLPERITWGSLLALGVSGGLVPCPAALVILLTAVSLNRTALGLLVLVLFSVGLATVLIAIGILIVLARPLMDRWTGGGRVISALPRISAVVIIIIGAFMAIRALVSGGIITVNL